MGNGGKRQLSCLVVWSVLERGGRGTTVLFGMYCTVHAITSVQIRSGVAVCINRIYCNGHKSRYRTEYYYSNYYSLSYRIIF